MAEHRTDNAEGAISERDARRFLEDHLGRPVSRFEYVGAGAWSRCFGFVDGDGAYVVRYGRHGDDFERDRRAAQYRSPALPVPEMKALGRAFDGYFAITSRGYGKPLETLDADEWQAVLPSLFAAFDAMRAVAVPGGYGDWDDDGVGECDTWSAFLLAVDRDTPDQRTFGWKDKLRAQPEADALFHKGYDRLAALADDDVAPHLVHNDLLNRNALADGGRLAAVFDWGCAFYGDCLYDIACFEFWGPWFPALAPLGVADRYRRHCADSGVELADYDARMLVCQLHTGLIHLAYHAHTGDAKALGAVAERLAPMLT